MERNQSIDLIKIIAMIMVVGFHVQCGDGVESSDLLRLQYGVEMIAIPLFFMVGGRVVTRNEVSGT